MGKNIGIWIDRKKAYIIDDAGSVFETIESNVSDYHPRGGSPSSTPYGNQDASGEKELQNEQREQMKKYVRGLTEKLSVADRIVVFGPAEAKKELAKAIEASDLRDKLKGVETADSMSDNQLKEWVRNYYNQ